MIRIDHGRGYFRETMPNATCAGHHAMMIFQTEKQAMEYMIENNCIPPLPLSLVPLSGVTDPAAWLWTTWLDANQLDCAKPIVARGKKKHTLGWAAIDPSAAVFDVNQCSHCGEPMDAPRRMCKTCLDSAFGMI